MNEHLRPPESSSIDGDLRTRLEGRVEVLEDGILLLESVTAALNREELDDDDVTTLKEAVLQLPRLNEALEVLLKHEPASALTSKFASRTRWVSDALTLKLKGEPPSLRAGVQLVLDRRQFGPQLPRPGQTRLLEGGEALDGLSFIVGLAAATVLSALAQTPWALVSMPFFTLLAAHLRKPAPAWTLLPDRLHRRDKPDLRPAAIERLWLVDKSLVARVNGRDELLVIGPQAPRLQSWLELLRGPWLANLEPTPRAFAVCAARDRDSGSRGLALVRRDGVLFLPDDALALALKALTPAALPDAPRTEGLLELLAHVPDGRWNALGEHLAAACDATWLPRGTALDKSSGEFLSVGTVQLSFALDQEGIRRRELVEVLLPEHAAREPSAQGSAER